MGSSSRVSEPTITVHLSPEDFGRALREEVTEGLTSSPKELSPKWLYDDRGCELFDRITRLAEYYPTRAEREILDARALAIVELAGADTLIELGSGTSDKTRILLDAFREVGALRRFVAFDVAEQTLRDAAAKLAVEHPDTELVGVVGDFNEHLELLPQGGTRMIAFLGGTIGNLHAEQRADFLHSIAATTTAGDTLLLGTDLVKDHERLIAAYDDAEGVTAEFDLNLLQVLNRELGADFDPGRFRHIARFDEPGSFMEMRLRSTADQQVHLPDLDLTVHFDEGEDLRTEISTKFTLDGMRGELRDAGLEPVQVWTDAAGDFALWLARR